jgi:nucleoside phosphorylase
MSPRLQREQYTVGWVCALSIELAAAQEMLDEEHENLHHDADDTNIYTLGRIGEHNVVIACLPDGQTGTHSAATVAMQMKSAFKSIRFGLMVGVGGGVPSEEANIRLGDVVVSRPNKTHSGVVQYDFGKTTPSGFERTGSLSTPPTLLLNGLSKLRANRVRGRSRLAEHMSKFDSLSAFAREDAGPDVLFEADYNHEGGATCGACNTEKIVERPPRRQKIAVYYGTIASGSQVMRDAAERDRVSAELGGVLCFEMEAAGLMNNFPCLVIRGICDYADSHKNKQWQAIAAGTAAACGKEVLSVIPRTEMLAYSLAKKWTFAHQDNSADWQQEQKGRQHARHAYDNQDLQLSYMRKPDEEDSPEWYVRKVIDDTITTKQLKSLSVSLQTQSVSWVRAYLKADGQVALTNALLKINRRQANNPALFSGTTSDKDLDREYDIAKCLEAITNNKCGTEDALTHQQVPVALVMSLISPMVCTRKLVSEILTILCNCASGQGHLKVLQAMEYVETLLNENGCFNAWMQIVEGTVDGYGIMGSLVIASAEVRCSGIGVNKLRMEYAVATLMLLNLLIDVPETDLRWRRRIRANFISSNIKRILVKMEGFQYDPLDRQIERFRENEACDL